MSKLLLVWVLASVCGFAQESPTRGPVRDANPQSSTPKEYQGCIIRSGGRILLTTPQGTEYYLTSSARKLEAYVGEEVKVVAVAMNPSDASSTERSVESGKPQRQPLTLDIEEISKVADHCASPN